MSATEATKLLDCARITREYGVSRRAAERMMERLPKVCPEGLRKTYVRREDLDAYLERVTKAA